MGWISVTIRLCGLASLLLATNAVAQTAPKATPPSLPVPAPSQAAPDRTTASFGDWTLRCERRSDMTPTLRLCELGQTIQRPGDANPLVRIALGRTAAGEPLRIIVAMPINVTFRPPPKIITEGKDPELLELSWMRCTPNGCFASMVLSDDLLKKLRARTDPGRIEYRDGTGNDVVMPILFRGLNDAYDAFVREGTR